MKRTATTGQLAAAMAAFSLLALVLESGGLLDWATRLDLGPLRTSALPVARSLHAALKPLHTDHVRAAAIHELARAGWSDDPAAAADTSDADVSLPPGIAVPGPNPARPGVVPEAKLGTGAPLAPEPPAPLAGDPPLLSALPAPDESAAPPTPEHPRVVALAGDSMMAVGLSSTILRQAPKYPGLRFVKAFKSGTGLARPEVFNWLQEYPAMLHGEKPDVVLVAIGANDGQGFVDNGVTYPVGGDGWQRVYEQRVEAYLRMVAQPGTQVIWLGLPPMKSEAYNSHIAEVNRMAYAAVKANPQATWFSTAGIIGDANGAFRDFGMVGGKETRLRQGDGIHLSDDGATLLTAKLLPWLSPPASSAGPQPTGAPAAPTNTTPTKVTPSPQRTMH